jgi:formylglycine-generating enzyme required for sulfatase activity
LNYGYALADKDARGTEVDASGHSPAPGTRFRDCPDCPEMIVVPAGSMTMGSSQYSGEKPQHDVAISHAFAVGAYHITRSEYGVFVRETGRSAKV